MAQPTAAGAALSRQQTHLSTQPAAVGPLQAPLVQLIADHRLWQSLQEDEESFSHRVITARWRAGNQGSC